MYVAAGITAKIEKISFLRNMESIKPHNEIKQNKINTTIVTIILNKTKSSLSSLIASDTGVKN